MATHCCIRCEQWTKSKARYREQVGEESTKKGKKRQSVKSRKVAYKICAYKKRKIQPDTAACKYFKPNARFYCHKYGCWLHILNCLDRRHNPKSFKAYAECKTCRQFEKEIKDIVDDYYINRREVIIPREARKLKRRKPTPETSPSKRKIKRRSTDSSKRKIKRRSKLRQALDILLPKEKPKRKLKRRK